MAYSVLIVLGGEDSLHTRPSHEFVTALRGQNVSATITGSGEVEHINGEPTYPSGSWWLDKDTSETLTLDAKDTLVLISLGLYSGRWMRIRLAGKKADEALVKLTELFDTSPWFPSSQLIVKRCEEEPNI